MSGQQPGRGSAPRIFQPLEADDPTHMAGYRLAARLGAGGMGKVYLSYTPGGRAVAVKVIRPEFGDDPEFRRRFAQEVRAAQRVQGLYTAPVIDADTEGPRPWLATAYVPGPSLADAVLAHGALPVETVLLLVAGMAEALHVIHGAGIVHRDLKPSNVLLAADGPRVIDFGIARAADATSLTGSGVTIGTPSFMGPEQAAGDRVTAATDIFALGQVAAYAATGTPAFGEGTSHGVLYRIVHEEPDLSRVPERLTDLVTRALAKDPAARPSLAEIIALCRSAHAETVLRRPEEWLPGPVAADVTVRAAAPAPRPTPPPPGYTPTAPSRAVPGHPQGAPVRTYSPGPAPFGPHHPTNRSPGPARSGGRALLIALAAALVFGVAGGGTAYLLLKDENRGTQGQGTQDQGSGGDRKGDDGSGASTDPSPTAAPRPEPSVFKGIDLTAGYHLTLGDTEVRPQQGEDGGYELSYDTGGYLDAESSGGNLVLLDAGQEGSLAACRANTRYTDNVYLDKLSQGRQVCVTTGTGHVGLVTVRGFSSEDSPSTYLTLDLTVWRNAA